MFPIRDDNPHFLTPYVTYGLIGLNVLAWVLLQGFGMEPALFANAYAVSRRFVTASIIGATSIAQLELALSAADVTWTEEMQKAVDALHQKLGNPCP